MICSLYTHTHFTDLSSLLHPSLNLTMSRPMPALYMGSSTSSTPPTNPEPATGNFDHDNPSESTISTAMTTPTSEPASSDGDIGKNKHQETFHGWMTTSATSPLTYQSFRPKPWSETDVDIAITHCGVCASDLHTMRSGWVSPLLPSPPHATKLTPTRT